MANTVLEALIRRRYLITEWPWRALAYLLTGVPIAFTLAVPAGILLLWVPVYEHLRRSEPAGRPALFALIGVLLIVAFGPLVAIPVAALERRRLGLVDRRPIKSGHRRPPDASLSTWLRTRYSERATWLALVYTLVLALVGPVLYGLLGLFLLLDFGLIVYPVFSNGESVSLVFGSAHTTSGAYLFALAGLAMVPLIPYLLAVLAGGNAALARALLAGGESAELRAQLVEVASSRVRLVDAFEAERRRIERDLHDGTQQRLVGLTLQLGLAKLDLPPDSPAARSLEDAHTQAKQLMAELRELIHGIHPQVLTDLGLAAAVRDLTGSLAFPVSMDIDLPDRPPAYLESTAYFVIAEALTNVAKHSEASWAGVAIRRDGSTLAVEVTDDGVGGADPQRGSGLAGLADRVAVVAGTMSLASPVGGPTLLRVELPW